MSLFKNHTQDEYAQVLADWLPDGKVWEGKNIENSNIRKLLEVFAEECRRLELKMNEIIDGYDINTSIKFLEEWETMLGIPDDCFSVEGKTDTERQNQILLKIFMDGLSTRQDYIDFAALLGYTVEVSNGNEFTSWPWSWPHYWVSSFITGRFTIFIKFIGVPTPVYWPWSWPHSWVLDPTDVLRCAFEKIIPANCEVKFVY